jgi:AraC-like DNA-binding protein
MTEHAIVITAVFFAFLVAVAISIYITYRKTNRVLKDNDHLANVVENLKEESEEHQKTLDELKEQLRTKDHVLKLQVETKSLRENIKDTKDMTDDELRAWIELQVMESRMFCDPELDVKAMAQKLGLTQKKIKQLLKDSKKYDRLYDYLTEKRVLYACELIKENPNWSMEAVSKEVGFVSRTTFQTEFKKHIGVTPAQYRQHTQTEVVRAKQASDA